MYLSAPFGEAWALGFDREPQAAQQFFGQDGGRGARVGGAGEKWALFDLKVW